MLFRNKNRFDVMKNDLGFEVITASSRSYSNSAIKILYEVVSFAIA